MTTQMLKQEWEAHPVTRRLHKNLKEARDNLIERLTKGLLLNSPAYEKNCAYITGVLEGLAITLEADLTDQEENDDKEDTVME